MKNNLFRIFLLLAISSFMTSSAFAYSEKVDVFVPSTGRDVKHSSLAQKMENATAKATKKRSSVNSAPTSPSSSHRIAKIISFAGSET